MRVKILGVMLLVTVSANAEQTVEYNPAAVEALRYPANQFAAVAPVSYVAPVAIRPPAPAVSPFVPKRPAPNPAPEGKDPLHGLPGELSGALAFTTDYRFRGVTQTSRNPAVQGNIDYNHESGAYIGVWASNIDFGDNESNTEFDFYAGYSTEIAPNTEIGGGVLYYVYPGTSDLDLDYFEIFASISHDTNISGQDVSLGASLNYSPDNFGESGEAYYFAATAATEIAPDITIDGHIGRQLIEDNDIFLLPDYTDWSLGVAYNIGDGYEAKLQYIDTDIDEEDCSSGCEATGVLTVSKSF